MIDFSIMIKIIKFNYFEIKLFSLKMDILIEFFNESLNLIKNPKKILDLTEKLYDFNMIIENSRVIYDSKNPISNFIVPVTGAILGLSNLKTIDHVDLNRYMGLWYEYAKLRVYFEDDQINVTALYEMKDDIITVTNRSELNGTEKTINGTARSIDPSNSKLKVTFYPPFEGDYWIVMLDENYRYAVVSNPLKTTCWILSRSLCLPEYNSIVAQLKIMGFNTDFIQKSVHT